MEPLERATVRPRQARYQAALRPDMRILLILVYLRLQFQRAELRPCANRARILQKSERIKRPCTIARGANHWKQRGHPNPRIVGKSSAYHKSRWSPLANDSKVFIGSIASYH